MKLAVIGGGSSYTPELIDGLFAQLDCIPVTEVWLMDPDAARLQITGDLAKRMVQKHGNPFVVYRTSELSEAVRDARYVVTQLRVGGMAARIQDEKLGLRHNLIGQETTGVGGFACALRTIPRILEVARAMEQVASRGFLVNFTNPSGILTEALIKFTPIGSVGLCNVPINIIMEVSKYFACPMEEVKLDYVGLNHLSWVSKFTVAGKDVTTEALGKFLEDAEEEWEDQAIRSSMVAAMKNLGMFCNSYLQYFYAADAALAYLKRKSRTRGEEIVV